MFLVSTEAQNNKRFRYIAVYFIRPDGSGYIAGMFNKRTNVYEPKLRITRANTIPRQRVSRFMTDGILEAPKPPLLGLLPALVGPDDLELQFAEEEAE